jgi:hypothetical protein
MTHIYFQSLSGGIHHLTSNGIVAFLLEVGHSLATIWMWAYLLSVASCQFQQSSTLLCHGNGPIPPHHQVQKYDCL